MSKFIVTIDSSCDGNTKELYDRGVDVIFYYYSDNSSSYLDDMNEKKGKTFFENMRKGTKYSTSQLNQFAYYDFFKRNLVYSKNIIHISLTEGLSSSINQARIAASRIKEEDPSVNIYVIDSLIACNGELVVVDKAIELRDNNVNVEAAKEVLEDFTIHVNTYFTTDTLTYFVRGGRLSKVSGLIGNMLRINPVLTCAPNGNLKVEKQCRGKKNAATYIFENISERVQKADKQTLYICHADNIEDANRYKELLAPIGFKDIKIYQMGPIIGSHTGPGLIAIFYVGKQRKSKNDR